MINYDSSNNAVHSCTKIRSIGANYWEVLDTFQFNFFWKNQDYVRSYHNGLFRNCRRQEIFVKGINYTIKSSLHVLPWLSCQDLAMILTSVPCIMICHDLDKGTMVNHDLARLPMIMASVPWLRTLGRQLYNVCYKPYTCLFFGPNKFLDTSYNLKIRALNFPKLSLMLPWNPCQDHD